MSYVRLIHWKPDEAKPQVEYLKAAGYTVDYRAPTGRDFLRELRENPPVAVIIDLSRLPSNGRDMGLAIRHYKSTRPIPIVFTEGNQEKVVRIKEKLPDAVYTTWNHVLSALKRAVDNPPKEPVVPKSLLEGYSGKPLAKKLGIKADSIVALIDAPDNFSEILIDLPEGVVLRDNARGKYDLIVWFTRSSKELQRRLRRMAVLAAQAPLWIAWPKKASGMNIDLTQQSVRKAGLAAGLVDYKVCSIDATWSGLLFTRRNSKKFMQKRGK